jgi:hypothetical protein
VVFRPATTIDFWSNVAPAQAGCIAVSIASAAVGYTSNCTKHSYAMRELELIVHARRFITSATYTGVEGFVKSNDRNNATHQEQLIRSTIAAIAATAATVVALLCWLWQFIHTLVLACRSRYIRQPEALMSKWIKYPVNNFFVATCS